MDMEESDPMCEDCRVMPTDEPLGWDAELPTEVAETAPRFDGHPGRECGEHRTVGPHRAWCLGCTEWCYPDGPCKGCEVPQLRSRIAKLEADVRRVIALHRQGMDSLRGTLIGDGECAECDNSWPCPTVKALNESNGEGAR